MILKNETFDIHEVYIYIYTLKVCMHVLFNLQHREAACMTGPVNLGHIYTYDLTYFCNSSCYNF